MKLLFDVGGTNIRLGVSETGEKIDQQTIFPNPEKFEDALVRMWDESRKLVGQQPIEMVVAGLAAPVSKDRSHILNGGNIPAWFDRRLLDEIGRKFETEKVYLENDAKMAALGEAGYGAAKGYDYAAYLTISTGVGGAIVRGGREVRGFEPAYQIVAYDRPLDPIENRHGLGDQLDGWKIAQRYGLKAEHIEDPRVWKEITRWSGVLVRNTIVNHDPDIIVIGGSLTKSLNLEEIVAVAKEPPQAYPELPPIVYASLGDYGGLYGALQLSNLVDS